MSLRYIPGTVKQLDDMAKHSLEGLKSTTKKPSNTTGRWNNFAYFFNFVRMPLSPMIIVQKMPSSGWLNSVEVSN